MAKKYRERSLDQVISGLPAERQESIRKRSLELIDQEMTLRELRQAKNLTQEAIAELLGIGQDSVSRLESRGDVKLSTLQNYAEALGGELRVLIDFADSEPIGIVGFD